MLYYFSKFFLFINFYTLGVYNCSYHCSGAKVKNFYMNFRTVFIADCLSSRFLLSADSQSRNAKPSSDFIGSVTSAQRHAAAERKGRNGVEPNVNGGNVTPHCIGWVYRPCIRDFLVDDSIGN